MNMNHEKVDFIFSAFIFENVVTHLMKHINFVAAMTREFFFFTLLFAVSFTVAIFFLIGFSLFC